MITIDEAGQMLDELAEELPLEFYRELNGGILLSPEEKLHPEDMTDNLFTLGEYHVDRLGRHITIYFGSFARVLGDAPRDVYRDELRVTLRHEFTHHVEMLAGERGLEIKDEERMASYRARARKAHGSSAL